MEPTSNFIKVKIMADDICSCSGEGLYQHLEGNFGMIQLKTSWSEIFGQQVWVSS